MGIKPKFSSQQIEAILLRRAKIIENALIQTLLQLGELCIIEMRTNRTFTDRTGNLISSGGYIVVARGRIVKTGGFEGSMSEGKGTGKELANTLATKHPDSYALYVVAGMNYAAYVEALGYNVLSSAEQLAEKELPRMLKTLQSNIKKMK